jgi:alcohol oxidase
MRLLRYEILFFLTRYSFSGVDCGVKMRPNAEELAAMSPEFDQRWSSYFANAPDKPVMLYLPIAA